MQYAILGPLEVRADGEPAPLPAGKQRTLLALLLLRANELVSADRLVDELWEGEPPETAGNMLQVYVSRLRKLVGPALERRAAGYVLHVGRDELDLHRFEELMRAGRAREALALWRGTPLADVELPHTALVDVGRLEELRLAALEERIEADLAGGGHAELVPELEALVDDHPLRERLRGQLMLALYRAGRQADALELYRRTRELLVEELGIDPSPELQELERAILRQDAALAAVTPPAGLPEPPTAIVGREQELEELTALLADARLVTLTGPGGIGKTRLALEAAHTLAPEFGGRVHVVQLAPIVDPQLVLPMVAQALGAATTTTPVESMRVAVGTAPFLLVLDNFEQVLGAAPGVSELLAAAPPLKVLVTSRATLRLTGEREYAVPPLNAGSSFSLFLERAEAVDREFELTGDTAPAVAEICARLEGVPLAIELAAARAKLLSPQAMLARLANRLDLLRGGARDLPERQQTLRATIDWSYDLLDEDEQRLFAQLAVFVGGWTLEAAEAVCDGDVLTGLESLADKSLVRRLGSGQRLGMLETVREYALERLDQRDDADEVHERHARYLLEYAEDAEPKLFGAELQVLLERLETEHDNLRAALTYSLDRDSDRLVRLAAALRRFWQVHAHYDEGQRWFEAAIERRPGERTLADCLVLNGAGIMSGERGDLVTARSYFERSLEVARELGAVQRIASALANIATVDTYEGRLEEARALYGEVNRLWDELGDRRGRAVAVGNLGGIALAQGDVDEAIGWLRESAAVSREVGDYQQTANAMRDLARALDVGGDVDAAREAFVESLELMHDLSSKHGLAECLEGLAVVGSEAGDPERAAVLFGAGASLRADIGARRQADQETWYAAGVERARAALGETAFDDAFERGRRLGLEAAVDLARDSR